jgi:P27 family predicted phage terminase small subunit
MGGKHSGGHNRKSIFQHIQDGTYRRDRHGPLPASKTGISCDQVKAPDWLSPLAKELFNEIAPDLIEAGRLDNLSLMPFAGLCQSYARAEQMAQQISEQGSLIKVNGKPKPHPLIQDSFKWQAMALDLLKEFGMTPASRGFAGGDDLDHKLRMIK